MVARRAGEFKHLIDIEELVGTQSPSGEETQTWTPFVTTWAAVEPITGSEKYAQNSNQTLSEQTHRVRISYLPGITTKMRVLHRGRYLDIIGVSNVLEGDTVIHLMCKEAAISHGT